MRQLPLKTPAKLVAHLALGEIQVEARFSELVRCDFPLSHWVPVPVEIPPNGTRSWYGALGQSPGNGGPAAIGYGTIHVPRYDKSRLIADPLTTRVVRGPHADDVERLAAATPVFALATKSHRIDIDQTRYLCASVLLAWSSRIAVVVSLDGTEGIAYEGAPSHEWHVRASPGMPVERALSELIQRSRACPVEEKAPHSLFVMPAEIGGSLLEQEGVPMAPSPLGDSVWGTEWRFDDCDALEQALERFRPGLQGFAAQVHTAA